jgi:hypothetical protein
MLIGVACLVVGGVAGYYWSEQSKTDYVLKGAEFGCASALDAESGFCGFVSGGDYLEKAQQGADICPPCGCSPGKGAGACCANCIIGLIENA